MPAMSTHPGLAGVLPPITTPFTADGELDLAALERNVERYNTAGLAGYVAFGSNGEAVHLTAEERRWLLTTLRKAAAPGHTVVAGVNELSTRAAIDATREAADTGADLALAITPYFYKAAMRQATLAAFFRQVADASPLPVLLYNVPQNTGVSLAPETIAELAGHGNIVGVKDSAGNLGALAETLRLVPEGFAVLVGNAGILYPALAMGATGAILAVACAAPAACVELFAAVRDGGHDRARELQERLAPVGKMVTATLGVAGLKAALDLAGYAGGTPRGPLVAVGEAQRQHLAAAMRDSGLFAELAG